MSIFSKDVISELQKQIVSKVLKDRNVLLDNVFPFSDIKTSCTSAILDKKINHIEGISLTVEKERCDRGNK